MSSDVFDHYDNHLGPVYSWMVGDFEEASGTSAAFFGQLGLQPLESGTAIDLGCGHGLQTIPLARLGFSVTAIDQCRVLLDELTSKSDQLAIRTVHGDLLMFSDFVDKPVDAIVCMGDTLTHLNSIEDVLSLFASVATGLADKGWYCLSFRDYTSTELSGTSRFIPVRSDDNRIHTCFLEYDSGVVHVHDVLNTRCSGEWKLSVSKYSKLRLAPQEIIEMASAHQLDLTFESSNRGMIFLAFRKTAS